MGLNFDVTAATPILKNRYTKKKIETLAFSSPAVGMMPKSGDYGGAQYVGAIRNAVTSSRSASDATAFTTGTPSVYKQWLCAWVNDYASANITGAAVDQAKGDPNALVDALTGEFDGAFIALGISLGASIWGNGGGAIGQISTTSTTASTTITLANINDVVKFYVGQILQSSTDDGTGGAGVRVGTVTLTGVNINNGVLTAAGNWSTGITGCSTSDYLFMQSDYNAKLIGFPGWIPSPAYSSTGALYTSFNGVNRTVDPVRLAGVNYAGNGAPKSETLTQLATLVARMGGKPKQCFVNPVDYADLVRELGTRAQIVTDTAYKNPQISFAGVQVATSNGGGFIRIYEDVFVPQGYFWMLNLDEWLMPSMGDVPKVLGSGLDGMEWLRVAGADAYQMRAAYRATTYCSAPGKQGAGSW